MASLKDLRNRIASVKATRKITQAMQMVAAAKLRRAQEAATAARPYAERMSNVMSNLNRSMGEASGDTSPLLVGTGKEDVHLLVVMTAERGLCGGFNANIAKLARNDIIRLQREGKTVNVLPVGRKGADILKREFAPLMMDTVDFRQVKQMSFENAEEVARKVLALFEDGAFDVCTIYFSEFKSVISQIPTALQLIPAKFEAPADAPAAQLQAASAAIYEYEPSQEELLGFLLERNIGAQIFRGLLENAASEQGARMSAMDNATRNAGEMIDNLTISYNRQRQAQITKELIEIISGAEAL
jgi:F-type H+-transporting ATPase subunit gamma